MIHGRVRANTCSHTAIIGSLIAETSMNKGIQTNCWSMRAKPLSNHWRGNSKESLCQIPTVTPIAFIDSYIQKP